MATITGTNGDDHLTGTNGSDTLYGLAGNDLLDGGKGADLLVGGTGDDTYIVDNIFDKVSENASEGTDLVKSSVTYTLGANIENLTLTGNSHISGTGNALDNLIIGNANSNVLDGKAGADSLAGGSGNDTYIVDNTGDTVTENAGEGTDLVKSSVTYTLGANVEDLTLIGNANLDGTGNALRNTLIGNSGNNLLDGGAGADSLAGGNGNDTYIVDNLHDTVMEHVGGGIDQVNSSVTYTLGQSVENLTLTGTANLNGTGNDQGNLIIGNSGNNQLSGGWGNDTLSGGDGNDLLDGGQGGDSLAGGQGNDTYIVDNLHDTVTENASEGTDLVKSSVSYTLGANIENLTLAGQASINGTGNALDNLITGNAGNNTLSGGDGNDTLNGGSGSDKLDGGAGNDTLNGGTGADKLTGGAGADTLTGGTGNDTFVYTAATDTGLGAANRDIITDFKAGDKIDVSHLDANLSTPSLDHWAFVTSFTGTGVGQVLFDKTDPAHPLVVFDEGGNGVADYQIELTGVTSLTAANFIL